MVLRGSATRPEASIGEINQSLTAERYKYAHKYQLSVSNLVVDAHQKEEELLEESQEIATSLFSNLLLVSDEKSKSNTQL